MLAADQGCGERTQRVQMAGRVVEGMQRQEDEYEVAMKRFLARKPWKMERVDGRRPTREELYDRPALH